MSRWRVVTAGALAAAAILVGCAHAAQVVSIDLPRMSPNPATIGTKSEISVLVFDRVGCSLASIKVTYGASVVSTKLVDIGKAYKDTVTVTGTGPVKAEASCGDAINTQTDILVGN